MRWAGRVAGIGATKNAYRIFVEKAEGNRPLGRPRRRRENNIEIDLGGIVRGFNLSQDGDQWRVLMNTLMDILVP
jgi:hypothetical protein